MITISLSRDESGRLYGTTTSDQWNLETLGYSSLNHDRNHADVKRLRRALKRMGMDADIRVMVSGRPIDWTLNRREREALTIVRRAKAA